MVTALVRRKCARGSERGPRSLVHMFARCRNTGAAGYARRFTDRECPWKHGDNTVTMKDGLPSGRAGMEGTHARTLSPAIAPAGMSGEEGPRGTHAPTRGSTSAAAGGGGGELRRGGRLLPRRPRPGRGARGFLRTGVRACWFRYRRLLILSKPPACRHSGVATGRGHVAGSSPSSPGI